jgi:hypothetical protein
MGENESVDAHHHRHRQLLGQTEGLDVQIDGFLIGLGEQLHPSGIAHRHRVRMVVPDVDRGADRAVAKRHYDRQSKAGGVIDGLRHEQETLTRRCGVGACAGRRGADGDG